MSLRWKIAQSAELKWWQNYLKKKPESDYRIWKKAYWTSFFESLDLSIEKNASILDAGCGPAGIFMIFDDYKVTAIDPLLDEYEAKLPHFDKKMYPFVDFKTLSLEELPDAPQHDWVFCLNAINHVDDLEKSFQKLVAATKPGGKLVVSIDAHNHNFLKHIFRAIPGDILHPHQHGLKDYEEMLARQGCKVEASILKDEAFIFNYYVLVGVKDT